MLGYENDKLEDFGLLRNVAEDMKTPLVRILSQVQLNELEDKLQSSIIETTADSALRLLDSYIMTTQIYNGQQQLSLEPVSVSAMLYDCSQYLARLARLQGCELDVRIQKHTDLAMANPHALQAALTSLGYSFLYAITAQTKPAKKMLTLVVRRVKNGIDAGIYSKDIQFSTESLERIRNLKGEARQLTPEFTHGSSAGIVIADALLHAMHANLRSARFKGASGLAVTLLPSKQLALL